MDLLGPIGQILPFLWDTISQEFRYCKDLDHNMATLTRETEELKCKHDEVEAQVEAAVSAGKTPLPRVRNWLKEAGAAMAAVDSIRLEVERGTSGCCCLGVCFRGRLGARVIRKTNDVEKLRQNGDFSAVAESPCPGQMPDQMEVPRELEQQRSSKEALEEILQWLNNEEVDVVCVWGMGGVGKTTLVKKIYNTVNTANDFRQVIWVTVSKDLDLQVIQKKIGSKLDLKFDGTEGLEEKRDRLYAQLRNVRYLLILDDLWCEFRLDQVGIPQPNKKNRCKIVITTRLNEVSNAMEADRQIKIKPLQNAEAWDLFCSKTDNVVLLPEIRPLAEKVAEECGGLPLAIITVGRAMRRKNKKELWQDALRALQGAAPEIRGMEREVFLSLKLSYDCLEDPKLQSCFLYFSLYPEDYEIETEELAWILAFDEGLVSNLNSFQDAINKGHDIVEKLMDACLLDRGTHFEETVRMHDLLRDLAIWTTSASSSSSSSSCLPAPKFLVKSGEGLEQPPKPILWEGMTTISLFRNRITELQMVPNCPNLVSLFLGRNDRLHTLGDSLFQFMPKLQVLDLSWAAIKCLPLSLTQLVNLRVLRLCYCKNLQMMPPVGLLKELQLLDLLSSGIESLPEGIESLAKLRWLELSHTKALGAISSKIISDVTSLEHLGLLGETSVDTLWEVEALPHLTSLGIRLTTPTADVMEHPVWSRLSGFFVHFGPGVEEPLRRFGIYVSRSACITGCQEFPSQINLNNLIQSTDNLFVEKCQGLESLFQIIGNSIPNLKYIFLSEVEGMKCVVDWRKWGESNALECLEEMFLGKLPCLEKVFDGGVPTGCRHLRRIEIRSCPKLKCVFSSSWFQLLHQLEFLMVSGCEEIDEIVERGQLLDTILVQLPYLHLINLPKLATIFSHNLVLASVKYIRIHACPKLKKLPVLSSSCIRETLGDIRGSREWWEGIEWDDELSKSFYSNFYEEREHSA